MKNSPLLLVAFLFVAGLFIVNACQKDELASPGKTDSKITFRAPPPDCGPSNPTWTTSGTLCAGENFTVTFCVANGEGCGQNQLQQWDGTDWVQVELDNTGGCTSHTVNAAPAGTYLFRAQWFHQGCCNGDNTGWIQKTVVVTPCCVQNTLTATVSCTTDGNGCNRHVTFTYSGPYSGAIVVQGGLTAFTTICSASSNSLTQNTTHQSAGGPSNVTRWEGNGSGNCGSQTVTIDWTSTNTGSLITGEWTVKDGDGNTLASLAPLTCPN